MAENKKTVWLPFMNSDSYQGEGGAKLQLNPISAFQQSESKQNIRMMVTAASLMAVFAVFFIGRNWTLRQRQNTSVGAMVNLKYAVQGVVTTADYASNTFTIGIQSSTSDELSASNTPTWTVHLAPGADFDEAKNSYSICYSVGQVERSIDDAHLAPCRNIISIGKTVVVQYVTLDARTRVMIAKAIYGKQ